MLSTVLSVAGLTKIYSPHKRNKLIALDRVTVEFYAGEFVAVLGPSGSGKSSFLHILGGLDREYEGSVVFEGQELKTLSESALSDYQRNSVGFVFQHFHLIPYMTALENVMLAFSMTVEDDAAKKEKCMSALKDVGMEEIADQVVSEMSGGQKQRVAIARALAKNPQIILADEPTGALDVHNADEIVRLLKELAAKGYLVIAITHNDAVANEATRKVCLQDGKIIETVGEIHQSENAAKPCVSRHKFGLGAAFKLSFHRCANKKLRYFLVSIGVIIGIGGLSLTAALFSGINNYTDQSMDKITDCKKLTVVNPNNYINTSDSNRIRGEENVSFVQPEFRIDGRIEQGTDLISFDVKPIVGETYRENYAKPDLLYGSLPEDNDQSVVLSKVVAEKLLKEGQTLADLVGSEVEINFLSPDTITNHPSRWDVNTLKIAGICENSFIGVDYSYVPYKLHQEIVRRSRFIGKGSDIPTNSVCVYMADRKSVQPEAEHLREKYQVTTPNGILKSVTSLFSAIMMATAGVSLLILIIAAVMVGVILYISVIERRSEIGIMKSLGARRTDIKLIFLAEAMMIGVAASLMGIVLSFVAGAIINNSLFHVTKFTVLRFQPGFVILCVLFGILTSIFAGLLPASKAAKLDPVSLLRD